jgi:hypothetical protein
MMVYIALARGVYKIGRSKNPEARMPAVKHTCKAPGFRLRRLEHPMIVQTVPITTPRTEKALHWLFRHKQIAGEWFALEQSDLEWIAAQTEATILRAADAEWYRILTLPRPWYRERAHMTWKPFTPRELLEQAAPEAQP